MHAPQAPTGVPQPAPPSPAWSQAPQGPPPGFPAPAHGQPHPAPAAFVPPAHGAPAVAPGIPYAAPTPAVHTPAAAPRPAPAASAWHTPTPEARVPGCPHGYALATTSTGFFAALALALKTLPYAFFRFAHWSLFTAISIAMVVAGLGVGIGLSIAVHKWVGVAVIFGTLIPFAWFWLPFVERKMFGAKCAHIALLTELITKGHVGDGKQGLFEYAKQVVSTRFGDLTSLWNVHRSVNRSLRQLSKALDVAKQWVPIDIGALKRAMYAVVRGVSRYLDAVVLSYGLARGDRDFADAAIDGVAYCGQNGRQMFKTGIGVLVLEWVMVIPLWLGAAVGCISAVFAATYSLQGGEFAALSGSAAATIKAAPVPFLIALASGLVVGGLIAMLLVRTVKESFIQPTLVTMVMLQFHKTVSGQPLDPTWKERLEGAGDGIGQLDRLRRQGALG